MFQPVSAGQIGHQRGGQQFPVLHRVNPTIGEPALVAQPVDMELDVAGRIAACDEVDRQGARWKVVRKSATGGREGLGHQLPAEGADRILPRMTAGEDVLARPAQW